MGDRVVTAQQYPRIPLIARQLRSRRFLGPGLRALVARASKIVDIEEELAATKR